MGETIMIIEKATIKDLDDAMALYEKARAFMRVAGNPHQWQGGYPSRELIKADIESGSLYVCREDGKAVAVFFFAIGDDPTYAKIDGGSWLTNGSYGVLHRIAVGESGKGIAAKCFDFCLERCESLRLDTHKDNIPMQTAVKKHGFSYCGIIYLQNGDERIAFEKISR